MSRSRSHSSQRSQPFIDVPVRLPEYNAGLGFPYYDGQNLYYYTTSIPLQNNFIQQGSFLADYGSFHVPSQQVSYHHPPPPPPPHPQAVPVHADSFSAPPPPPPPQVHFPPAPVQHLVHAPVQRSAAPPKKPAFVYKKNIKLSEAGKERLRIKKAIVTKLVDILKNWVKLVKARTIFNKMQPLEEELEKFINHHHEHMHFENNNQFQAEDVPMYTGTASQFVESPYLESPYLESAYLESPYLGFKLMPNVNKMIHGVKAFVENQSSKREINQQEAVTKAKLEEFAALFKQDEFDAEAINTVYDEMADEMDKLMNLIDNEQLRKAGDTYYDQS